MSSVCASSPPIRFRSEAGHSHPPDPHDEDDGIHIVSVTRIDIQGESALRVVVAWFEEGERHERDVELLD